jgi:hypothetical protein
MKVTILFKGIGIGYTKDDILKMIFPIDECHQLTFAYQKNHEELVQVGALANPGRRISVEPVKATSETGTSKDIDDFIDLTAAYAHDDGVNFKQNWRKQAVEMTLSNAFLSLHSYSEREFMLMEGTTITKEPSIIGASLKAEIEIADGGKLNIQVDNKPLKSFDYEADADYTLIFDNDCYENSPVNASPMSPGKNDFYLYYNVIEDAQQPGREFSLVAAPQSTDSSGFTVNENSAELIAPASPSPDGEYPCYPVWVSQVNSTFP